MSHWVWQDADRLKWWLYLLLNAQWEDTRVVCGNQLVEVKRGQLLQSVRNLAKIWGVCKNKAFNFIELLQNDGMITVHQEGHNITIITICNYESYQDSRDTNWDTNEDTKGTRKGHLQENKEKNQKKKENNKEVKEEERKCVKEILRGSADSLLKTAMEVWNEFYYLKKGIVYSWPIKDRKYMKEMLEKIKGQYKNEPNDDETISSLKIFLKNINDPWTNERLTVAIVNMKFDELLQQMVNKVKKHKKTDGVGTVDFRPYRG